MSGNRENSEMLTFASQEVIETKLSHTAAAEEIPKVVTKSGKMESEKIAKLPAQDRIAISQAYARILQNGGHLSC